MDQAVLGKRRNPNTGDNSLFMWLVALMSSLAGAGATLFGINKTKKKDED